MPGGGRLVRGDRGTGQRPQLGARRLRDLVTGGAGAGGEAGERTSQAEMVSAGARSAARLRVKKPVSLVMAGLTYCSL
jgi:hypothetical protein